MGWLFGKMGQPRVVGEIVAGVLLGPSLLGWTPPSALAFLFPAQWLGPLYSLSQGVISPTLFSMMVIMALVTTLMTSPLLSLLAREA
jgi:K+:H+ antiporter